MAKKPAFVSVGFEGRTYEIPAEVAAANARQPGLAADYIRDQIAGEEERKAAIKQASDLNVEREFKSVRSKLARVDSIEQQLQQQADAIGAYKSANEALTSQVQALQATGTGLGSASSDARDAAGELALQTSNSSILLEALRQREESMRGVIDGLENQVASLEAQLKAQVEENLALGQSRQRLMLDGVTKLEDRVLSADEVAREAQGVANQALQVAKGARQLTKDQVTEADLLAMVQAEIRLSAEQIVELVLEQMKPQFPHGFAGPRMDADYMDQTSKDRLNANEIRVGLDEAVKKTLRDAGSV